MARPDVEPPSRQLVELLSRYALATPADLRRCRAQVRRLAHDLPTFDSVWIDALTQCRVLTPFQAKLLESEEPQRLQVGPCILVDEWEKDGRWTLRAAKHRGSGRRCLLTFVDVPANELPRALQQVRGLIASLRDLSHPSIVVPQGCDQSDEKLVVVSPFVTGPTLKQLLVRRGRFPVSVVSDLAWQLIDGLATLAERDVVHGDLTLTSIRLTERGQAVLLHPGVMPAIGGRVSIHAPLNPDNFDGIAPELISTGRTATAQSDLYAVGCLLWHLLAGRPPFPTGDPLAKLALHQTKPIDDVRRWVPDAPPKLAELIVQLTAKNPDHRGGGPKEVRDRWPLESRARRRRLAQFHSSFGAVAPRHADVHRSASKFPLTTAAVMVLVLSGLSLALLDAGARNELLRLAGRGAAGPSSVAAGPTTKEQVPAADNRASSEHLLSFPTRPIEGIIELTADGPYAAENVNVDGPLVLRAAEGVTPQVQIGQQPLRLTGSQITIEGVRFVCDGPVENAPVLVAAQCQQLMIDRCCFDAGGSHSSPNEFTSSSRVTPTAIAWKVVDVANPTGGKLLMRSTVFSGPMHAVDTHTMPRSIAVDNCLKCGGGALIRFAHAERLAPLRVHLRQTTLRESGGVIRWSQKAASDAIQPMLLIAENCVFDVRPERGALLEFTGATPPGWQRLIRITGEGSLLRAGAMFAASLIGQEAGPTLEDISQVRVEGLLIDEFEFASADVATPAGSVIIASQAPRSSPVPPGIDADVLTDSTAAPVVRQVARP